MVFHSQSGAGKPAVSEPQVEQAAATRLTPRYRVLIHNDDVTPMDLVVLILLEVFKKPVPDAMSIMLEAHHSGVALVTVLPLEEAELRVEQAHGKARTAKYPLTFSIEPE